MAWTKIVKSGAIVNADLTGSAGITGGNIAANAIDSDHYTDGSIDEAHIAADAVNFATHLKAGTDGELITWDASGNPAAVAVGTDGHVLTSGGAGVAPTFEAAGSAATRASLGIDTDDSPQFAGVNIGSAADTTLTGSSGVLSVEGKAVYQAGGTDVAVIDGGTGSSSASGARTNLGLGNSAVLDTAAIANAGTGVATADQIHTFVTTQTDAIAAATTGNATTATTASIATTVTLTDEGSDSTCFPVFAQSATGNIALETDTSALKYNSTNGTFTATTFVGALTGNASGSSATCVGQAGTVATITGLAPDTATTQATQGAITSAANLATVGTIGTGVWSGTALVAAKVPAITALTGYTAAAYANASSVGATSIVSVGTVTAGAWRGDTVDAAYGGTGVTSMTALKNLLDGETWTFAEKVTMAGDLDVQGTTTTINSANTSFTDTSIQLNVADGESAFGSGASATVFGCSTGATSTGRIINQGSAGGGFKFMDGNATNTPAGNNNISDGANYVDVRVNGLVLKTQSEPTEVEGMLYWNGSDLYIGNPS